MPPEISVFAKHRVRVVHQYPPAPHHIVSRVGPMRANYRFLPVVLERLHHQTSDSEAPQREFHAYEMHRQYVVAALPACEPKQVRGVIGVAGDYRAGLPYQVVREVSVCGVIDAVRHALGPLPRLAVSFHPRFRNVGDVSLDS